MDFDVAVVGASSAGLYAAKHLARAGRTVVVLEQQTTLVPARRTLIITPQLYSLLDTVPDAAILHRIHTLSLVAEHANVAVRLENPDLIVERSLLTQWLAEDAQQAGAQLCLGYRFRSLEARPDGVVLHLHTTAGAEATLTARSIIGADGVFSDVARAVGLQHPAAVPILQAEVQLPQDWNPGVTQVWFDREDTRFFYWLIPESADRGVVGLVGDDRAEIRPLLQRFLARHGLQALDYQGAQVALYDRQLRPWTRVGTAPVLLVGDAAGHVKVTTVGGTVSGLWGADAAVRALVYETPYARELRTLRCELDVHWLIRWLLDHADDPTYDRLIANVNPAVQQFLRHHNRDQMAGKLWTLAVRQPSLLGLGARLLLRGLTRRHAPDGVPATKTRFGRYKADME